MTLVKMELLAQRRICDTCGTALDAEMLSGFCPGCLLDTVLESETEAAPGSRINDYELLNEVARGGMGIVYRARQRKPSRVVALKMILPSHIGSLDALTRFRGETEAAASLDHEGILPIYAVGEKDGVPFYSMKFAEGGSLASHLAEFADKPRESAQLISKVARAVAHAHEHGILHRDLKPGNVLFDAASKPFVSDFGLARWLGREGDLTQTLAILGTPFYMAPEQTKNAHSITAAADIYSLGAILFHLLTGQPPFRGENAMEVLRNAAERPAPRPRTLNGKIPADLETVCLKCLEKNPAARYSSATALADDLDRFLARRTILARRANPITHAVRWIRRNPSIAGLGAASVLLLVLLLFVLRPAPPQKTQEVREAQKSIAVLPFENLSSDKENAFFTDGMQEEILTDLAKIAELKVISRTSVMHYGSSATRNNLREIAQALNVAYVVEGSVQRSANRVRVSAQLINARNETHVWAEKYDRELADVFAIQSEIAKAIADQLQAKLSPNEKKAIEQPPTTDLAAFDLYSWAKSLLHTAGLGATAEPHLRKAIELLDQAVKRDPSFFDAYCQLAYTHETIYAVNGFDHTPARLALAEAAVQAATQLRPDAAETHLARAQYLYYGRRDFAGALAELEIARRGLPNDPRLFEFTGYILRRRRGQQEEGLKNLQRAVALDPRNLDTLQQTAVGYLYMGRYADAVAALDRALAIVPDNVETRANRGLFYLCWKADTRPLHETIDAILAEGPSAIASAADIWFFCALAERDPAAAERALVALGDNPCWSENPIDLSPSFGEGLLARMTKDEARARTAFEAARAQQEKVVRAQPDYAPTLCVLGLIDAALGRKDLALDEGRRAIALMPVEKDVINGSLVLEYFAITAAWAGEKELALQQLEAGLRAPTPSLMVTYGALKLHPVWDPLRGDPRFEKIVASLAPKEVATSE
jgi:serine/threonine protein kinase/Tfp pilus assembly protein PilF